jgi:hypothetical protein
VLLSYHLLRTPVPATQSASVHKPAIAYPKRIVKRYVVPGFANGSRR